jgi:hypothetical protein
MRKQPPRIRKTPTHCCHSTVSLKKMMETNMANRKLRDVSGYT